MMNDGKRQRGLPESSLLSEVDEKEAATGQATEREDGPSEEDGERTGNELTGPTPLPDDEEESSDDEGNSLVQKLREELEESIFWDEDTAQQPKQKKEKTDSIQPELSSPQSHTARRALLMEKMDEEQLNRFEAYRRSTLSRASMKKLVSSLINQSLNDEKVTIVLCSLGKMFVGDLIESARRVADQECHTGALTRSHVYQAYRNLERSNKQIKRKTGQFFSNL